MKKLKLFYPCARVHHICVWLKQADGSLYSKDRLQAALDKHEGGWASYAYILHSSDVYDAQSVYDYELRNKKALIDYIKMASHAAGLASDETTESGYVYNAAIEEKGKAYVDYLFPRIEAGQKKPPHWHIVLTFSGTRKVDEIARWFGIDPSCVEVKTGRGAAENAWLYLVHARDPKKYQYLAEDVVASFDYASGMAAQLEKDIAHEKYHLSVDDLNDVLKAVAEDGLPLNEAADRVSIPVYLRNERYFLSARRKYVNEKMPMPWCRVVYYIESEGIDEDHGRGGIGKTTLSKAMAKQLAKEFGADPSLPVEDPFNLKYIYTAGDSDVFLQNYDGQPVLLIDEINGSDLKRALRGINGVKSLLSPFPERKAFHVKHSAVNVTAKYIIINGIQSHKKFIKDIVSGGVFGGYQQEDESAMTEQIMRRIWADLRIVRGDYIEFWINRGLFENTPEQELLTLLATVKADIKHIAQRTSGAARAELEHRYLLPLLTVNDNAKALHSENNKITELDDLGSEFSTVGEVLGAVDSSAAITHPDVAEIDQIFEEVRTDPNQIEFISDDEIGDDENGYGYLNPDAAYEEFKKWYDSLTPEQIEEMHKEEAEIQEEMEAAQKKSWYNPADDDLPF